MRHQRVFALAVLLVLASAALAVGPLQPAVEFLFENNVVNYGLAGGVAEVYAASGYTPTYAAGGAGGTTCLDNTSAAAMAGAGGVVRALADAPMATALINLRSFTVMGWMKSPVALTGNAGIVACTSSGGFRLRTADTNRLALQIDGAYYTSAAAANYAATDWVFFAVTYDGTRTQDNIRFYYGHDDGLDSVTLDGTLSCFAGTLFTDPALLYVGNVNTAGTGAFDGYLDSIRVFASKVGADAALTGAEIGAWKNRNSLDTHRLCRVDLRFEGNLVSEGRDWDIPYIRDWNNNGLFPVLRTGGLGGGGYLDFSAATAMGDRGPYAGFSDAYGVNPQLCGARSLTIMGWLRSALPPGGNARIVSYVDTSDQGFELYAPGGNRLCLRLGNDLVYSSVAGNYGAGAWTFFAVRFDGSKTTNNVWFMFGHDDGTDNVTVDAVSSLTLATVPGAQAALNFGNRGTVYPFDGYLDDLRIFVSHDDGAAALYPAQVQLYKNLHASTIVPAAPPTELRRGDVALMRSSSTVPTTAFAANRVVWNYDTHRGIIDGFDVLGVAASQTMNFGNSSYFGDLNYADGRSYTNDPTLPSRARNFDGDVVEKDGSPGWYYPGTSIAVFQDDTIGRTEDILLPLRPYNVQFDDSSADRHAAYLGYGPGFHAETRANFRAYLDEKYTDAELLANFNITDISTFDYRTWLQTEYGVVDNADYVARRDNLPLTADLYEFMEDAIVEVFTQLHSVCSQANRPALLSSNLAVLRWYTRGLIPVLDFLNMELPRAYSTGRLDEQDVVCGKLAEAFDKLMVACNNCHVSAYILDNGKPNYMKCLIAAVYAGGNVMMAPWNLWACDDRRYYEDPTVHGAFFHFVRDHAAWFDDYEPVSQVGLLWNTDNRLPELNWAAADLLDRRVTFDIVPLGDRYPFARFDPDTVAARYDQVVRCSSLSTWSSENQQTVSALGTQVNVAPNAGALTLAEPWIDVTGNPDVWVLPRRHATDPVADRVVHVLNRSYDRDTDGVDSAGCTLWLHERLFDRQLVDTITWVGPETPQQELPVTRVGAGYEVVLPETPIWSVLKVSVSARPAGDVDGDGTVTWADVVLLAGQWLACNHYGQAGCQEGYLAADVNEDGVVDLQDWRTLVPLWP